MKLFLIFLIPFLVSSANATPLRTDWPRLTQSNSEVCSQALILAQAVNATSGSITLGAKSLPAKLKKEIKLYPAEDDISAGAGYVVNKSVEHEVIENEENTPQRKLFYDAALEWHFVVEERPFGWRGDMYSLFLLNGKAGYNVLREYLKSEQEEPNALESSLIKQITRDSIIPIWFWQPEATPVLAITPSDNEWKVWGPEPAQPLLCEISFFPVDAYGNTDLPPQMKHLNQILLQIIGTDGPYSGTMNPVSHLKAELSINLWPNILYRPHTFVEESQPYNTRAEVEAGLQKWAGAPTEKILLESLKKKYPQAEAELVDYYQTHLKMSPAIAQETAERNLDILFRKCFVFEK